MLRSFEETLIDRLKNAYLNKENVENLEGVSIFHEPFTHCIINDVIIDDAFLNDLSQEMISKLKYKKKNNDLYKFHQTLDLGKKKFEKLKKFCDEILYGKLLKFLKSVTKIELNSTKIDVTSSKYGYTDYLLCHDDDIHDDNGFGRRIAFVFYLVPSDWSQIGSDGGNLDLFRVDDKLNPIEICKSLVPVRNSLICFEVSDRSFHQVSEVLSKTKTRLSINGWFHGPINHRPEPVPFLLPEGTAFKTIEPELFFEWISEKYLNPTNQSEIQLVFSSSSEIKLDEFFNSKKYAEVNELLSSSEIKWKIQGPANKKLFRYYETAELDTLPRTVQELIEVLTSDCMGLCLSNMTALRLHPSMPKSKETDETSEDDDDHEEENDQSSDENEEDQSGNDTIQVENKKGKGQKRKNEDSDSDSTSKPCSSKSISDRKKLRKEEKDENLIKPSTKQTDEEDFTGKCFYEVRRWKKGYYTLITDNNGEIRTKALDMMLFFKCKRWSLECGGNVSYIARNEDVEPEENCASLVYRDEETLKFTKCVNSRLNETENDCFYEISLIYYE